MGCCAVNTVHTFLQDGSRRNQEKNMDDTPLVILNGNAGDRNHDEIHTAAAKHGYLLEETRYAGHGTEIACRAAAGGKSLIMAAGGDGTVREVASGIMQAGKQATLGIIPLGTGNDLCRSLKIEDDVAAALHVIDIGRKVDIDVGRLATDGGKFFFFNVSSCGFAGAVDKHLEESDKVRWRTLSYIKSGISALTELESFHVEVFCEDESCEDDRISVEALNVVVGNGRYAASGIPVAPEAMLTDGKLDLVIYLGRGLADQVFNSKMILQGEQHRSDTILSLRAQKFAMKFSRPLSINYDGELHDEEVDEVRYTIHSKRLRVIVGRDFP